MRAVLQRVTRAEVRVDGALVNSGSVTLILDSPVTGAAV